MRFRLSLKLKVSFVAIRGQGLAKVNGGQWRPWVWCYFLNNSTVGWLELFPHIFKRNIASVSKMKSLGCVMVKINERGVKKKKDFRQPRRHLATEVTTPLSESSKGVVICQRYDRRLLPRCWLAVPSQGAAPLKITVIAWHPIMKCSELCAVCRLRPQLGDRRREKEQSDLIDYFLRSGESHFS